MMMIGMHGNGIGRAMMETMQEKYKQQMKAYREMADADLFDEAWVEVAVPPEDMPGYKAEETLP